MQNKKIKLVFGFLLAIFAWFNIASVSVAAANQSDPVAMLQYAADGMVQGLKTNKATLKTKPQIVYGLAHRYVVPYAALTEMSKRVIPPQIWNSATSAQRAQFQKEFTKTLIRTYASALTSYEDQTVQFYPVRGSYQGADSIVVNSQIVSPSSAPIHVSYRLIRVGSVWRLIDMSVEGVSMLDSFRSQFSDILAQGTMAQLLDRLSQHNRARD